VILIVMGVAGTGKSTVGRALAERLGWQFRDGDDFHPPANVLKMKSGTPLNDDDRRPWLIAIQEHMQATNARSVDLVIACSALKELYRHWLLKNEPWVRFVHLTGSRELIAQRLAERRGHYMPPSLLDSQLATLETPDDVLAVDITPPPNEIVSEIVARLNLRPAN
jgi:gluconokinase